MVGLAVGLTGCWSFQPRLPEVPLRQQLDKAFNLSLPADAVVFQLWDVSLPAAEVAVLEEIWREADELVLSPDLRPLLRANGFRVGLLGFRWPKCLTQHLARRTSASKACELLLGPGKNHFQPLGKPVHYFTCPIYYAGECSVAEYSQAQGGLRMEVTSLQADGVTLRVEPVIRHHEGNPARLVWQTQSVLSPAIGQTETRFPFLAATLTLQPRETLLVGASREKELSLGSRFLDESDHQQTHLILVHLIGSARSIQPVHKNTTLFPQPVTAAGKQETP